MKQNQIIIAFGIVGLIILIGIYFRLSSSSDTPQNQTNQNNIPATIPLPDTQNSQQIKPQSATSLADVVKEWRKSTAYIICDWNSSDGSRIQEVSGSGLLATLNSTSTIITNKHVVYNPTYGYANRCSAKFPDDNGNYIYTKNNPIGGGTNFPDYGTLTVDSNGNDVAYISGMHWVHVFSASSSASVSDQTTTPPSVSLSNRSKNSSFACSNKENTGNSVLILGYPVYGSQINEYGSQTEPTATEGIISGIDGIYYTTSAKIDHGNSGGLAIDETNDCYAGIPTWNESGSFESLGRILPSSTFLSN